MREIHAYQNNDGTYKVEIVDIVKTTRTIGRKFFESTDEGKINIPRAGIQIVAYKNERPDGETLTFTVRE